MILKLLKSQNKMKNVKNIYLFILLLMTASCFDSSKPNYQFFPQMYDAVGYDPVKGQYIEGYEEKPIKWVRIHKT